MMTKYGLIMKEVIKQKFSLFMSLLQHLPPGDVTHMLELLQGGGL